MAASCSPQVLTSPGPLGVKTEQGRASVAQELVWAGAPEGLRHDFQESVRVSGWTLALVGLRARGDQLLCLSHRCFSLTLPSFYSF